jgi:hypothetical protein
MTNFNMSKSPGRTYRYYTGAIDAGSVCACFIVHDVIRLYRTSGFNQR